MADGQDNQQFDPVAEARSRYPGLAQEPEQKIVSWLAQPDNFRSAFPEYSGLDNTTIGRNMGEYAGRVPAKPTLWDAVKNVASGAGEQFAGLGRQVLNVAENPLGPRDAAPDAEVRALQTNDVPFVSPAVRELEALYHGNAPEAQRQAGAFLGQTAMAAIPEAAGAISDATAPMRAGMASRLANSALGTPKGLINRGFDPGAEIARQDIAAATRGQMRMNPDTGISSVQGGLAAKIDPVIQRTGAQLDSILNSPGANQMRLDVGSDIAGVTRQWADQARRVGDDALADRIEQRGQQIIRNSASQPMSPSQAHALKVDIGDQANWKNPTSDDDIKMNSYLQDVYGAINDHISQAVPGTADLQRVYGNMTRAKQALESTVASAAGRDILPATVMSAAERLVPFPTALKTYAARALMPYGPPEFTGPAPMSLPHGLIGPGAIPLGPAPDTSFVRGEAAQYPLRVPVVPPGDVSGIRPIRLLGPGPEPSKALPAPPMVTPRLGYSVRTPEELLQESANVTGAPKAVQRGTEGRFKRVYLGGNQ